MSASELHRCENCSTLYDWRKSTSRYLKMTYCCYTCERKANGFLIEDFERVKRIVGMSLEKRVELARLLEMVAG